MAEILKVRINGGWESIPAIQGKGVSTGGLQGQVLTKKSNQDFDTEWQTPAEAPVKSVNGQTGVVVLDSEDIGLGEVENQPMDSTPTANSAHYVTSGGVKSYVDTYGGKIDTIRVNGQSSDLQIIDKRVTIPKVTRNGSAIALTNNTFDVTVPTKTSDITNDSGYIDKTVNNLDNYTTTTDLNTELNKKLDKTDGVTAVTYDTTNKKLTETINGTTTDIVTLSTVKTDLALKKSDVGLGNVDNKSEATIKSDFTGFIESGNTNFALGGDVYTALQSKVDNVAYDSTNKKITKTIAGSTSDVVSVATIKSDLSLTKSDVGLSNVDNKSEATIKSDLTGSIASGDTNFTTGGAVYTALEGKEDVDATILRQANVVNNVTTTSTVYPLSANMGKELQDQIDNLKSIGRYLSNWNCMTGLPTTNPTESPYTYHTGDYFLISVVDSSSDYAEYDETETYNNGDKCMHESAYYICAEDNVTGTWDASKWVAHTIVNYKPDGTTYTIGVASTVTETKEVSIGDYYLYDNTRWILLSNTQKTVTFANIAGEPEDNTNLAAALNEKVDKTITVNDHPLSSNVTVTKTDVGLSNVDNKSETTIKADFTGSVASGDTGFPTGGDVYTAIESHTPADMTGATESAAGTHGLVPAPAAGDQNKYLQGNGTWTTVDALPTQTGQSGKYLTTDGTTASWANVIVSNTSFGTFVTDATNTSYTYNHGLNTQAVMVQVSNSSYETIQVDVTRTNNNNVTIEFATAPGVGTYNIYCVGPTTTSATSGEEVYY